MNGIAEVYVPAILVEVASVLLYPTLKADKAFCRFDRTLEFPDSLRPPLYRASRASIMSHTQIKPYLTCLFAAVAVALLAPASFAKPVQWSPNFDACVIKAKQQKKFVLAYFSGSDWDEWGRKLEKEVLTTDLFSDWV